MALRPLMGKEKWATGRTGAPSQTAPQQAPPPAASLPKGAPPIPMVKPAAPPPVPQAPPAKPQMQQAMQKPQPQPMRPPPSQPIQAPRQAPRQAGPLTDKLGASDYLLGRSAMGSSRELPGSYQASRPVGEALPAFESGSAPPKRYTNTYGATGTDADPARSLFDDIQTTRLEDNSEPLMKRYTNTYGATGTDTDAERSLFDDIQAIGLEDNSEPLDRPGYEVEDEGYAWEDGDNQVVPTSHEGAQQYWKDFVGSLAENESGLSQEELDAQIQNILSGAGQAKSDMSQQMAARGFGASGVAAANLGNIDAQAMQAAKDLIFKNATLREEMDMEKMGTLAGLIGTEGDLALKEKMFEQDKAEQNEADYWNALNSAMGLTQEKQLDRKQMQWIAQEIEKGTPVEEIIKAIWSNDSSQWTPEADKVPDNNGQPLKDPGAAYNQGLQGDPPGWWQASGMGQFVDWQESTEADRKKAWGTGGEETSDGSTSPWSNDDYYGTN